MADPLLVHDDCRHFEGHIPCSYHKTEGVHCDGCPHYDPVMEHILIIKLGALGDVIRTTPILERLKADHPAALIYWLTLNPEILPDSVDRKLPFDLASILFLEQIAFDLVINLDKDREACALADRIEAQEHLGFRLRNRVPAPASAAARETFISGLFDDISRENTKSYPQELFEICGYTFAGERYAIRAPGDGYRWNLPQGDAPVVGLNTGCGTRWTTRKWPEEHWSGLARALLAVGYRVVLLGGPDEDGQNRRLQSVTGAWYEGTYPLDQFANLVDRCSLVVTAVTMTLHLALALEKRVVLLNNIFNRNEFELFGLGTILEPPNCTCYYAQSCDKGCMNDLTVEQVYQGVVDLLQAK